MRWYKRAGLWNARVDPEVLASTIKQKMIESDPDSWWGKLLESNPDTLAGLKRVVDNYDGAPDAGPMPSGDLVSLAYWAVSGEPPVDLGWIVKTNPWLSAIIAPK